MTGKTSSPETGFAWLDQRFAKLNLRLTKGFWWPPMALLAVVAFWYWGASGIPTPAIRTVEKYGVYGDSFGRLTSFFTALGFGGLIITLLLQQRQIRKQEEAATHNLQKEEEARYEEILFRLMDIYRQTLSEVSIGERQGRDVLRRALDRVDSGLVDEGMHAIPRDLQGRWDSETLTASDLERIDYLHFRNFKIVATEIHPQARLVDTFEVVLAHMVHGVPDHLLVNAYKELVFAQLTFIECRYFFLVALSHTSRGRLRDLLAKSGFFDRLSRSQIHLLHRDMYHKYWGYRIDQRELPASIPMSQGRIKRSLRAYKAAGGVPKTTYTSLGVRQSQTTVKRSEVAAG